MKRVNMKIYQSIDLEEIYIFSFRVDTIGADAHPITFLYRKRRLEHIGLNEQFKVTVLIKQTMTLKTEDAINN